MTTPLANKTTVSSRNKMAALSNIGAPPSRPIGNHQHLSNDPSRNNDLSTASSRLAPRTAMKPSATRTEQTAARLAATSSRIALPRSRLSGNRSNNDETTTSNSMKPPATISATPANRTTHITSVAASRSVANDNARNGLTKAKLSAAGQVPSFANSRSSSKLSSISSSMTRQASLTSAQATVRKQSSTAGAGNSNYIPDTNSIRKGLAKFSNPIECQRQFQALNSEIRHLKEINDNKERVIDGLQEQLQNTLNTGLGYATVVQYFAKKLKIDSKADLVTECEQLKSRVETLMVNETEYENKLEAIVSEYKNYLRAEQDLRANLNLELDEARASHSAELEHLREAHRAELQNRDEAHEAIKSELESQVVSLEAELGTKTRDLAELRKEYELLNNNFNKLEDSLTKDKDARVKYFQDKVNQLQKDVDSLNSVLEMRTERIHALEKDSILLNELQSELATSKDQNKSLKQQLESLQAALENKREQFEKIFADHEKISQELRRERKERRRMTMRSEQLEYVLNESCATENNVTVIDSSSVET